MSGQHLSMQHMVISAISQLSLNKFEPNFKCSFLWPYPMAYVWVTIVQETFVLVTFVHMSNLSAATEPIFKKLFGPNFLGGRIFFRPKFCYIQSFWEPKFLDLHIFGAKIFLDPKSFWTKLFWTQKFVGPKILLCQNFFGNKFF